MRRNGREEKENQKEIIRNTEEVMLRKKRHWRWDNEEGKERNLEFDLQTGAEDTGEEDELARKWRTWTK